MKTIDSLTTHDVKGLSSKDMVLARLIDQTFSRMQATPVSTVEGRDDVASSD